MPTIELNKAHWGSSYAWPKGGDEWSEDWGSVDAQWFGSIFPRIHAFIPATHILEIAPGFGRWTQYLKNLAGNLSVVDLNENCIQYCRQRFSSDSNISYHVNDGMSLAMIPDNSIDFAFSFDSLVHVELPVLESYLTELSHKLTANGVGFFHHSNIGEYGNRWRYTNKIPTTLKRYLTKKKILNYYHLRAFSVTAAKFEESCHNTGLRCISQELVNWRQRLLIDAFSVFTREDSLWAGSNRILRNKYFMKEASMISSLSELYSASLDSTGDDRRSESGNLGID